MASENATEDASVTSSGLVAGDDPLHHTLPLLIIQVGIIICVSRSLALLLRPLKQPRVVAEILGGILLGPTALGNIPGFTKNIFPQSSLLVLETVAEIGLIFFLFLVGLELNIKQIRKSGVLTIWMAAAGIILPFGLGAIAAYIIRSFLLEDLGSNFGLFALFLGVALSITAFPVLARILAERKLLNTEIGSMAMSAAALNDVVAWILLALAVAISNSGSSPLVAVWVLLLGMAFLAVMFLVVSPILHALAHHRETPTEPIIAVALLFVLGAAFLTDLIGIHVIFGAFVCGLIIPQESQFAAILTEKIEDYVTVLFLPLYFAVSGLKTQLSAINNGAAVLVLLLVIATACVGKVLGTFIVAKLWGVHSRKAIALGFLMNTKGLVELIVLNIGLSKGVLNQQLFAIMVIMTLVTTFMTTPIVMWLYAPARDIPPYKRRSIDCGDVLGSFVVNPEVRAIKARESRRLSAPDDREALMLARRMLQHGGVKLTVIQFVIQGLGRHRLYNIRRISSRTSMSRLQTKSAPGRGWSVLKCLGREVVNFFAAPWLKTKSENLKHSTQEHNGPSSELTREVDAADAHKPGGEVHVSVDNIVSQTERNMDMQALAPILASATKAKKEEVGNSGDNDVTQGSYTTNSETDSDSTCGNLTLRVIETKNPEVSVLDIVNSAQPNGLIIIGLHLHENSPIMQSGTFPAVEDHGLGPLGDFLVSKKHLHVQASLLVVKQHNPSQTIDSRSSSPPDSNKNLLPVADAEELSPSDSSAPSDMEASTTSVERDDHPQRKWEFKVN